MKEIREQYVAFCLEYFKTGNGTQSAIKAGYSPKTARQQASKLLQVKEVKQYLAELRQKVEDEKIADLEECLKHLTKIIRSENINTSDRLKAIDMRLKTLCAYSQNLNIKNDTIDINVRVDEDDT